MSKTVTVTGAAGAIGYAILFRIASGQLLGPDEKVRLRLLEIEPALKAAEGTAMELVDCAFPLLEAIDITADPNEAFDGANVGLLIGARPRTKGMERADLLEANGAIFKPQGKAINDHAADDIKVLVVGNPANTNALIAMSNAPDVPRERFTAMTRLDQNRAYGAAGRQAQRRPHRHRGPRHLGQPLARRCSPTCSTPRSTGAGPSTSSTTWRGTRTSTCPTSASAAPRSSRPAARRARRAPPTRRSTTSTTGCSAPTAWSRWRCRRGGQYGVDEGLISSFPVRVTGDGTYEIVEGLEVGEFAQSKIDITVDELKGERDAVKELGLI